MRLFTRGGHDFSKRFPLVVAAVATLSARSCLIDGEAIVSDDSGLAVFELLRSFLFSASSAVCGLLNGFARSKSSTACDERMRRFGATAIAQRAFAKYRC